MTNATDVQALRRMRATIKGSCTRIKTYVESVNEVTPAVLAALEVRRVKLDQYWIEYNKIQTEVESIEEDLDRDVFENAFYDLAAKLQVLINTPSNNSQRSAAGSLPPSNSEEESARAV